jgi:hypothetical protein
MDISLRDPRSAMGFCVTRTRGAGVGFQPILCHAAVASRNRGNIFGSPLTLAYSLVAIAIVGLLITFAVFRRRRQRIEGRPQWT